MNIGAGVNIDHRDWTDLPEELLTLILAHLFLDDVKRFHHVCRTWKFVPDPIEHYPVRLPVVHSQWLMHKDKTNMTCKFFHPVYNNIYCLDVPELSGHAASPEFSGDNLICNALVGSVPRYSKDGWLLMSEGDFSIFFCNPFTRAKMYLPNLPGPDSYNFRGVTFLSTPETSDCLVFGIQAHFKEYVAISMIRRGENDWKVYRFENNLPIVPSSCTPVFHNGMFYCLGEHGNLGVFDPHVNQWTVLANPKKPCKKAYENYLMDCDGELISVFVGRMGLWISVFRLDESKMAWVEVTNLGDNMLFLNATNSFSRKKVIEGMQNKIYFPRLHEGYCVFYSLDARKYLTFGNDFSSTNLYNTKEQLECCWIEPRADH